MKKLLGCQIVAVLMSASALAASPQMSSLTVSALDLEQAVEARLSLTLEGENYECKGPVNLTEPSTIPCGDQRQVQVEFQTFSALENAVISVSRPGRQEGFIYLSQKQGLTYPVMNPVAIRSPGYGSLSLFVKYVIDPMKASLTEEQIFKVLPHMLPAFEEVTLSTLRDKVVNREYEGLLSKIKEEPKKEEPKQEKQNSEQTLPKQEEAKPEEPKKEEQDSKQTPPKQEDTKQEEVKKETPLITEEEKEQPAPAVEETPTSESVVIEEPPQKKKTNTVVIYHGTRKEVVEVPDDGDDFPVPSPRHRVWRNPHGYDLRHMSAAKLRDLERRGLIFRDDGN